MFNLSYVRFDKFLITAIGERSFPTVNYILLHENFMPNLFSDTSRRIRG